MLFIFRKYQRFLFIIISVVTIASFSFFGTYTTLMAPNAGQSDETVFTAVDGTKVRRSELESFTFFIASSAMDKYRGGGSAGPNFLNDGVIERNFLETGMGRQLACRYSDLLSKDLGARTAKEKKYRPYQNPKSKPLSAKNIWAYFAPEIPSLLQEHKALGESDFEGSFRNKTKLYLAEQQFPSEALRRVLQYQEQQYPWLPADPYLEAADLSLFGYRNLEDWYGPRFVRLIAEFIINAGKIAEQKGYHVSREEAVADLLRNAQASLEEARRDPRYRPISQKDYLQAQLRIMGIDFSQAADIWRQVLLFRRLFQDFGNSVVVDTLADKDFLDYANQYADGHLYRLPEGLRLRNFNDLQLLELYLSEVSDAKEISSANLPTAFLSAEQISKKSPSLVQNRYLLEFAKIDSDKLQSKIAIKEMWNWQKQHGNWKEIQKEFPALAKSEAQNPEERFLDLERLTTETRSKIDEFSRKKIIAQHPEWIEEMLAQESKTEQIISIRKSTTHSPLEGISDMEALASLLAKAPCGEDCPELQGYTQNNRHYYNIRLLDKSNKDEVLTFAEARKDGTLNSLLKQKLQEHYGKIRDKNPELFQKPDGAWKEFASIENQVAQDFFKEPLNRLASASQTEGLSQDALAAYRLSPYAEAVSAAIEKDPKNTKLFREEQNMRESTEQLEHRPPLNEQWKLLRSTVRIERNKPQTTPISAETALTLIPGGWTKIVQGEDGDLAFFHLEDQGSSTTEEDLSKKVKNLHTIVSNEAQNSLLNTTLETLQKKGAISLRYMDKNREPQTDE